MTRIALVLLLAGPAVLLRAGGAAAEPETTQSIPAPAQVQSAPPPGAEDGRYTLHRMGDGFVRLDSRTGELSQCNSLPAGWTCKAVPDERAALESEIGRLQQENAKLKKTLLARGVELPGGMVAPPAPPVPPANIPDPTPKEPKAPADADLDRAFTFMKNVWKRLVDMVADLQRDIQKKG